MAEVLHSPSTTHSSSNSSLSCVAPSSSRQESNVGLHQDDEEDCGFLVGDPDEADTVKESENKRREQLSLLALLVTIFRKSLAACKTDRRQLCAMEIGWPTNVRHVAHVTFDRFNGFLGLPVEFEPEVPRRPPSASTTVFGVSTDSMQLSYDSRGNSVPTILMLMQRHLYSQGGLQAEGIFRINAENSQEEYVRDQLNRGVVPDGVDIHCLAGLIKAWFRELPTGVLDSLSSEQVMHCQTEDDCAELARHLPNTEAALLDWAINLMADVVQLEHVNKMNARNIAMVFAPNMTQMADPLTALMYAVQVMNFLKMLILRTLREREDTVLDPAPTSRLEPFDENDHQSTSLSCVDDTKNDNEKAEQAFIAEEPVVETSCSSIKVDGEDGSSPIFDDEFIAKGYEPCEAADQVDTSTSEIYADNVDDLKKGVHASPRKSCVDQSSCSNIRKSPDKISKQHSPVRLVTPVESVEKTRAISNLSRIDARTELIEAWR
ncbi:rho GTPase-activating protein 5 [Mercurialis annua]|uniref:rho GTPase-activating protein 5 n=1 Tax=Mercurialis annua TaxID=3986 RepID=UPI00215F8B86|nr:rho GTPase-activating protein 5 [Mercurialis annua]